MMVLFLIPTKVSAVTRKSRIIPHLISASRNQILENDLGGVFHIQLFYFLQYDFEGSEEVSTAKTSLIGAKVHEAKSNPHRICARPNQIRTRKFKFMPNPR